MLREFGPDTASGAVVLNTSEIERRRRRYVRFIGDFFAQRADDDESVRQAACDIQEFAAAATPEELRQYLAAIEDPGRNPYQTSVLLNPRIVIEQARDSAE
ncbi:MAG TPA: hypothetical protein VF261_02710 [Candidatus Saccharimonadales bacterium]